MQRGNVWSEQVQLQLPCIIRARQDRAETKSRFFRSLKHKSGSKRVQMRPGSAVSSSRMRMYSDFFLMSHPQSLSQVHKRWRRWVSPSSSEQLRWKKKPVLVLFQQQIGGSLGCGVSNGWDISQRLLRTPLHRRRSGCVTHAPYDERSSAHPVNPRSAHAPSHTYVNPLPSRQGWGSSGRHTQALSTRQHHPDIHRLQTDVDAQPPPTSRLVSLQFTSRLMNQDKLRRPSGASLLSHWGKASQLWTVNQMGHTSLHVSALFAKLSQAVRVVCTGRHKSVSAASTRHHSFCFTAFAQRTLSLYLLETCRPSPPSHREGAD